MPKPSLFCPSFLLAALAVLAGCPEVKSATAALVVVRVDDDLLASELSMVRAEVYPAGAKDGSSPTAERDFELAGERLEEGLVQLPFSFGIEKTNANRFLLVVTGYRRRDAEPVIERKVLASFTDRQTVLLEVVLSSVCYGRERVCSSLEETCYVEASVMTGAGSCGDVVEASVERVRAGDELDAASHIAVDAGGLDADHTSISSMDGGSAEGAVPRDAAEDGRSNEAATAHCEAPLVEDGAGGCTTAECMAMPCQHGGECSGSGASRRCDCSSVDYEGPSCETKIDDCRDSPCPDGRVCEDGVRSRACSCPSGTSGPDCTAASGGCAASNVCSGVSNGVQFGYPCADTSGGTSKYRCVGQFPDGPVSKSIPGAGRFSASDGVVTDTQTGLRWQQTPDPGVYPWAEARTYCSRLALAGGGWRLPSRAELTTLVHYGRVLPTIDTAAFPDTAHDAFWTASPFVGVEGQAWAIYFSYGGTNNRSMSFSHHVRCVR